jgi:hypothetical protein
VVGGLYTCCSVVLGLDQESLIILVHCHIALAEANQPVKYLRSSPSVRVAFQGKASAQVDLLTIDELNGEWLGGDGGDGGGDDGGLIDPSLQKYICPESDTSPHCSIRTDRDSNHAPRPLRSISFGKPKTHQQRKYQHSHTHARRLFFVLLERSIHLSSTTWGLRTAFFSPLKPQPLYFHRDELFRYHSSDGDGYDLDPPNRRRRWAHHDREYSLAPCPFSTFLPGPSAQPNTE